MTVAVDFDGTITRYKKFKGKGYFDPILPGVKESFEEMKRRGYTIIINTTRIETYLIKEYLNENEIPWDYVNYNPVNTRLDLHPNKVIADVYIDDRNIQFNGNWQDTMDELEDFNPWWRYEK